MVSSARVASTTRKSPLTGDVPRLVSAARADGRARTNVGDFLDVGPAGWRELLAGSHLSEEVDLRGDSNLLQMAWTSVVTERAVDWSIAHVTDPMTLAVVVAQLSESGLHTYEDPRTGSPVRNLAASKRRGVFFTPPEVASLLAQMARNGRARIEHCLEPGAGTGILSAAVMVEAVAAGASLGRLEIWEYSPVLADRARRTLEQIALLLNLDVAIDAKAGDAIPRFRDHAAVADAIVMNPPYGRLKVLSSLATDLQTRAQNPVEAHRRESERMDEVKRNASSVGQGLGLGNVPGDLQSLFMAGALSSLRADGWMSVISPASWLTSAASIRLRRLVLERQRLTSIVRFPESDGLFRSVNQPTVVSQIGPEGARSFTSRSSGSDREISMSYGALDDLGSNPLRIPDIRHGEAVAFENLRNARRLRDTSIRNRRGEVDLTLDKSWLSAEPTEHRLVRGDHIERFELRAATESKREGYLSAEGAEAARARRKGRDAQVVRVAGRQVSYLGKARRLSFTVVPPAHYLANSCNYVVPSEEADPFAIAAVLNSSPLDWWFKVHSSNNHVSNLEIDDLPWPLSESDTSLSAALSSLGEAITQAVARAMPSESLEDYVDALVLLGFGASPSVADAILRRELSDARRRRVVSRLEWFTRNGVPDAFVAPGGLLQHSIPTMSDLDRRMVESVPQGGNWQSIPESIPSARLAQIRKMSSERGVVRTSYYGRLRPDQPAYTIATYYNRPGNGTNIHPHENRTLTHREAARLQSFTDDYFFAGRDGAVRKQIGNAVPPLLARAVGGALVDSGVGGPVVDLFAGAGGLSAGLELAGLEVAVAVDNDAACELTYTVNRPSETVADPTSGRTLFVRSDLSDAAERESAYLAIRQKLGPREAGVLVGGPPCQGFSYAGFRDGDDERNDLAIVFLDIVKLLQPQAVVIENVEGLLTYRGGSVIRELQDTLCELGYLVGTPWVLAAEQFGVPQMRRRVFVVASRDRKVEMPSPVFARCRGRREVAGADPTGLPYPPTVAEALAGLPALGPRVHAAGGDRQVRESYSRYVTEGHVSTLLSGS